MKGLKRILNWTIWSIVVLHIVVLLSVQLPSVQRWLGSKTASALSEALGTHATVGRVSVGLFNRLIVDDVCIPDLQGDTLLRAGRLSVKASLLSLLEGRIVVSSAQLFGAHVRLSQADSTTTPNWQFVVDAFSSDNDTTISSPLDLHIGSLIVRHSSVSYDRSDVPATPGRFNPAHIAVSDISSHITLKSLTPDSLSINLKRLSLREHSGLALKNFTARLIAGPHAAQVRNLCIELPHTALRIDTLDASYAPDLPSPPRLTDEVCRRFMETVRYSATIDGMLTPADLFPTTTLPPFTVSTAFSGTAKSITFPRLDIDTPDGSLTLKAAGSIHTLHSSLLTSHSFFQAPNSSWSLQVSQLEVATALITTLKETFPAIPDELLRLGNIHVTANAQRQTDGQTYGQAAIATSIGDARLFFAMESDGQLSGEMTTDSLHLGRLLANDDMGSIAATIDMGGSREQMEATANVHHLLYKGYAYHDIAVAATYQPREKTVTARVNVDDAALSLSAEGTVAPPTYHLSLLASHFSPQVLGLSSKWGDASFSGTVDADITATGIADARGHLRLGDFTMRSANDSTLCHIDHLQVTAETDGTQRLITLNSDVAVGELSGQFDLASLPHSLTRYLSSRLPTLPHPSPSTHHFAPNNFSLHLTVSDTRWMKPLLDVPLVLGQPLNVIASVDDDDNSIDLSGRLPAFAYSGSRYRDLHLSIATQGDSTLCDAALTKMNENGGHLALAANMHAANNNLISSLTWRNEGSDTLRNTKGILNTVTQLCTDVQGKPVADISVKPSLVMVGDTPWHIHPSRLTYGDGHLRVDSFAVISSHKGPQGEAARGRLVVDGTASASHTDTLSIDMEGIDIAYIQDLLDFHPVDFTGQLGVKAHGTAVLGDFAAWADVVARDFHFMDGTMGTLLAQARWNSADTQIDIHAVADDSPTGKTHIDGFISPVRSDIGLNIRAEGSNIEFCRSFTNSFLRDISGTAHGTLELAGPLGDMNLTGMLTVDGQMTVDALNTTYRLKNDTVLFVPNDIQLHNAVVTDRDGHTATLSGGIHHEWLSNFTFDIDVATDNALVYDFPSFDGSNICGTVRATGRADLHGRPGEIIINCDVTPQAGSTFAYNAANPDAVSKQEFITWEKRNNKYEISNDYGYNTGDSTNSKANQSYDLPPITSNLEINFLINATPEATLRVLMDQNTGDYITLNGEGTIRATFHNKGPFHMFGTYTVDRGTYGITIQNIIKKNFTFQRDGSIVFGGDPYDAALNLQAVHTVNGVSLSDLNLGSSFASNTVRVNCLMNILGTPSQPRVEFDLEMPTVNSEENQMIRSLIASEQEMNQQVLYLLGIGRFYTQGVNNADAQQYGQTTLAMQSFLSGTVSTQINEVLSQVIKSNDWNFGANISTGDEGWNNAEYEGMVSGRMLDNRLLINGQFGYRDNATTTTPSFIGDFDLQYLLKRNGNLAVKVYNQTNDRYFTRSSLNTQGIGLVMKKDFNGLSDLWRRKKKTGDK